METQPGSVNWARVNTALDLGEAQAMAWHAVAHGADALLYWQWRSALGGQEQYHGTLVDQSGQPRPFFYEAQMLGRDFAALGDLLDGSQVQARVAMLNDYESRWSIEGQPPPRRLRLCGALQPLLQAAGEPQYRGGHPLGRHGPGRLITG